MSNTQSTMPEMTNMCREALKKAIAYATQLQQSEIRAAHLLACLLEQEDGLAIQVLTKIGAKPSMVLAEAKQAAESYKKKGDSNVVFHREIIAILSQASHFAHDIGDELVSADTLLVGIMLIDSDASNIIKRNDASVKEAKKAVADMRNGQKVTTKEPEIDINALHKYSSNVTQMAREGKIDPVIGRDGEIRRVIQILSRRRKNNPVVVGEPGTGKSAIIEGLARRIIDGDVPMSLKNKEIYSLDLSSMLAGASLRGQFEERLKAVLNNIKNSNGKIITFIDEIHTIVGSGESMDISNMIKPMLARGELHLIGATTIDEYRQYIEKDPALERRFQQVLVEPPSVAETVTILRGIKEKYETHHGVHIQDSALVAAAQLSDRYITNRFLPDKAIDLVDEASSRLKMEIDSSPEEIDGLERAVRRLEIEEIAVGREEDISSQTRHEKIKRELANKRERLEALKSRWNSEKVLIDKSQSAKKELQRLENESSQAERNQDYMRASDIRYKEIPEVKERIKELEELMKGGTLIAEEVTPDVISEVVSAWTGIPAGKMLQNETSHLMDMEKTIQKEVIGQDQAVSSIAYAVRRTRSGIADPNKPTGSFMFLGKSGTGKTHLAKSVAKFLFNDENAMVRIDMSEYSEKHDVSKLIGAPPGYVGYEQGGMLSEAVRRRPYTLVLFDEVEKAHPEIFDVLLQVLDEGRLTDSQGRKIDFRNTIIVLTSNLGAQGDQNTMIEAAKSFFKPEFINRLDALITFNDLSHDALVQIVDIQLNQLRSRLEQRRITMDVSNAARDWLAVNGYDPLYGARPIRRLIQEAVGDSLSTGIITGEIQDGDHIVVSYSEKDDYLVVTKDGYSSIESPYGSAEDTASDEDFDETEIADSEEDVEDYDKYFDENYNDDDLMDLLNPESDE